MKILIDSCVLINASIYFKYKGTIIKEKEDTENSRRFFGALKGKDELGYVTKTIEDESKTALLNAVKKSLMSHIRDSPSDRFNLMELQETVSSYCLVNMDTLIEECTSRSSVDITEREKIKKTEIEPFFKEIMPKTERYRRPQRIPKVLSRGGFGRFLKKTIAGQSGKYIYIGGDPKDNDLRLMAEAVYFKRKTEEAIFISSLDNHFVPNRIFINHPESSSREFTGKFCSGVRDELNKKFGFIGDRPNEIIEILKEELKK